jgi:hypothetical protein
MMNKRKTKRFAVGGMSDEDVASFAGTPENESNAGMAMEAGMMEKEPEENFKAAPKAKAAMVTKEQLAKSGLSLRDYMNKQQGLTRRGEKAVDEIAEVASKRAETRKATEDKPKLKYQSLQDRAKSYEDERAKSGVGMYGTTKAEPKEERKALALKSTKSESGNTGMGAMKFSKGGSTASRRADGCATKGKTKGRMV